KPDSRWAARRWRAKVFPYWSLFETRMENRRWKMAGTHRSVCYPLSSILNSRAGSLARGSLPALPRVDHLHAEAFGRRERAAMHFNFAQHINRHAEIYVHQWPSAHNPVLPTLRVSDFFNVARRARA